jgi:hypothetical protein
MKYKDFYLHLINEGTLSSPTVVVDVQPEYNKYCGGIVDGICNFLNNRKGPIVVYFNGDSIGSEDDKNSIIDYYLEHGLNDDVIPNMKFIDKGYGFFRVWMDNGMDRAYIIKAIRFMVMNKKYDSRDVTTDEWEKLFADDWNEFTDLPDIIENDSVNIPDVVISDLKKLSGCYLVGGAKEQCLAEFRLLFDAFNINYRIINDFTY